MKTIGILGGMSAASTQTYYRELCRLTAAELGGLHSPQLLIRSVDFADIEALQVAGAWDEAGQCLQREAQALERGGAELLVLATNTMHKVAEAMMTGVSIPLVHIADATAERIVGAGLRAPGLMATAFTIPPSCIARWHWSRRSLGCRGPLACRIGDQNGSAMMSQAGAQL